MEFDFGQLTTNQFGEAYFQAINHDTFADHSAESVYQRYYPEILEEEDRLNIIVGSDSGLFYRYLTSLDSLPKNSFFIFIDYANAFQHLELEPSLISDQVQIYADPFDFDQLAVHFMPYVIRQKVSLIRSLAVQDAQQPAYKTLANYYEERYGHFIRQELISLNSKPFIDAQLDNIADNLVPLSVVRNKLEGSTALILGGGPTLDQAIAWIKENQQKVVIFAAARIANRLLKEGIKVDIFVSVDPHDVSFDNSKGIFSFAEKSLLIHSHHINPRLLSQWTGVSTYLKDRYPWSAGEEPNVSSPGPNVMNTATNIAVELGCNTIIFSGVDLCFVGTQAFESGSAEAKVGGKYVFADAQKVETNAGTVSETQPMYAASREMLEQQVSLYLQQKPSLQFVTLGLDSARIQNVQYVAPSELVLSGDSIEFEIELMRQNLSIEAAERLKKLNETKKELQKQQKRFHELSKVGKESLKTISKLYDDNGQENLKASKKIHKSKNQVFKLIGDDGDMLFHYEQSTLTNNFKPIENELEMAQSDITEQLESFFNGISRASELFLEALKKAVDRVDLRIHELKGDSPMDLHEQWEACSEYGRALLWEKWNSDRLESLSEPEQAVLEKEKELFQQEVEQEQTQQLASLKESSENLPLLLRRADKAYEDKDLQELESILNHLESIADLTGLNDLKQYISAMQLALKEESQAALNEFEAIEFLPIRHQALKRALDIATQARMNEKALELLEALCRFSLDYMLPYASLLEILGHPEVAIEVIKLYLQNHPKNEAVKVQLAQRYIRLQALNEAKEILHQVLVDSPNNQTARALLEQLS